MNISNTQHRQVHMSNPQQSRRMVNNFSISEQVHVSSPQQSQVRVSNPQYNQRNEENFPMSQQDRDTSFVQYRNMQQEQREPPPFNQVIRPPGFMNQGNFRNENGRERPRETGNYVLLR